MKNKKTKSVIFFILFTSLIFMSCRKEPIAPTNESELITTIKLTLKDTASPYTTYTFIWKDIDGDGGTNPIIDSIKIQTEKTYNATLLILDESTSAIDTISNEIEDESTAHQFFYQSIPTDAITNFTYTSFDTNNQPLGNTFSFNTKNTSTSSTLRISLIHQPQKSAIGVIDGNITNAGGETDIEIEFPVKIF